MEYFTLTISTHDKEELDQGHNLSFEEFVDGSLGQTSHLPPVREQGEPGPEEADGVDEDDADADEIVIQKLRP